MDKLQIKMETIFPVLVILFALADIGSALSCYQCNSTLEPNCQDKFDSSITLVQQFTQECQMSNARYCIKTTGVWGGVVGTFRFCSSRDLGDQCQDLSYMDHDRMYRACVYTCSSDGCNSSTNIHISTTLSLLIGLFYLLFKTLS